MTRAPKYLKDLEVYEVNTDNRAPVGAEKTAETTASLPVFKKSYRDALIGVKALSVSKQNTRPTMQGRMRKECWPAGHIDGTDGPEKFRQSKQSRQLGKTWQSRQLDMSRVEKTMQLREPWPSDKARKPTGSEQMSRPCQAVKLVQSDIRVIKGDSYSRRIERQQQKDMAKRKVKSKDDRWVVTSDERGCVMVSGSDATRVATKRHSSRPRGWSPSC